MNLAPYLLLIVPVAFVSEQIVYFRFPPWLARVPYLRVGEPARLAWVQGTLGTPHASGAYRTTLAPSSQEVMTRISATVPANEYERLHVLRTDDRLTVLFKPRPIGLKGFGRRTGGACKLEVHFTAGGATTQGYWTPLPTAIFGLCGLAFYLFGTIGVFAGGDVCAGLFTAIILTLFMAAWFSGLLVPQYNLGTKPLRALQERIRQISTLPDA